MNNNTSTLSNHLSKNQPGDDSRCNASSKDPATPSASVEALEAKISSSECLRYHNAPEYSCPSTALSKDTAAANADARKGSIMQTLHIPASKSENSKPGPTLKTMGSSNEIVDNYSILSLLELIEVKDWTMFQCMALSSSSFFRALTAAIANSKFFNGMTLLHAVVRYNAPLTLVTEMMSICPEMTTSRDCLGRTALHVAAGCRASPAVIEAIAKVNPAACDATDQDGNTPLHFACDSSCVLFEEDRPLSSQEQEPLPPNHDAIAALLSQSIHAATIECHEEKTSLEHAILSGASIKSVNLLQSSAAKYLQLQKGQPCVHSNFVNLIRDQTKSKRRRSLELESMSVHGSRIKNDAVVTSLLPFCT